MSLIDVETIIRTKKGENGEQILNEKRCGHLTWLSKLCLLRKNCIDKILIIMIWWLRKNI